jgi:hypothetical protein
MQANGFGGASPPTSLRAKEPHGSGALAFFNPASNQSLAQQFINWRSRCPRKLQPFVGKLAAVFDVET